ncbi:hypothetical protein [Actinoalloteichus hymeniacidonis]|uniref:Uncharacterized protein n=1 Tax=Actinoalloteichus hymeniacidonis TaxID=340345 RepID=A0AAC9MX82_9PSEU|nr:hypothetical protein [Actinoalloteichus hymeniacidonis]AOS61622.1 hypothetical protein TL08_03960 [Actinoalloteichus hymeniacidonis]MBB5910367.1 hypothetical protein [Actinoalloteichus hymeniacidonis]
MAPFWIFTLLALLTTALACHWQENRLWRARRRPPSRRRMAEMKTLTADAIRRAAEGPAAPSSPDLAASARSAAPPFRPQPPRPALVGTLPRHLRVSR